MPVMTWEFPSYRNFQRRLYHKNSKNSGIDNGAYSVVLYFMIVGKFIAPFITSIYIASEKLKGDFCKNSKINSTFVIGLSIANEQAHNPNAD